MKNLIKMTAKLTFSLLTGFFCAWVLIIVVWFIFYVDGGTDLYIRYQDYPHLNAQFVVLLWFIFALFAFFAFYIDED